MVRPHSSGPVRSGPVRSGPVLQELLGRYGLKTGDAILAEPKHEALYQELAAMDTATASRSCTNRFGVGGWSRWLVFVWACFFLFCVFVAAFAVSTSFSFARVASGWSVLLVLFVFASSMAHAPTRLAA